MRKTIRINFLFFLATFVCLSGGGASLSVRQAETPVCHMYVFNVGAANFILFTAQEGDGQKNLIVDAGYDAQCNLLNELQKQKGKNPINKSSVVSEAIKLMKGQPTTVIISHFDKDHYSLLKDWLNHVIKNYTVFIGGHRKIALGNWLTSAKYAVTIENKNNGQIWTINRKTIPPTPDKILEEIENCLGDGIKVRVLLPDNFESDLPEENRNDDSLVTLITIGKSSEAEKSVLICGDASMNLLAAVYETYHEILSKKPIDVLIPSHHGSVTNGQRAEFCLFKPRLCILSTRPQQGLPFPTILFPSDEIPFC